MAYIGTIPAEAYTSFAVQHFTTSATDTFTLDFPVANENEIALFINNVRQEPGSSYAYTASGTTLTLSSAITGSDSMYCVFIGKAVQTVTPASGSVTNDMLAGSIANAKLANSSITLNGSAVSLGGSATTATTNGITEADQWRITTSTTHGSNYLTSNWERNDTSFSKIGTGMTQSSGVFTFPSTGIYHVSWVLSFYQPSNISALSTGGWIGFTTDNSTYDDVTDSYNCIFQDSGNVFSSVNMHVILDITDTANQKVKFASYSSHIDVITNGATDKSKTHATFIRLGDT